MKAQLKPRIDLDGRIPLDTLLPLETPLVVFVDPSSACNLKCVFCPTGHPDLIAETGRFQGAMKFDLFCKIIDDLKDFGKPIKVLRLYKDGEPFLNKRLAHMVAYARHSGVVENIDTTTNAVLMTPERLGPVLEAGIDRINVSVDGMTADDYLKATQTKVDAQKIVENVRWLYANRGHCQVVVKTIREVITPDQEQAFYDTFGNHCDRIFVENYAPCWPEFDIEGYTGVKITEGLYGQEIKKLLVCPYIFYTFAVNVDGLVSACFQDWERKLVIGDGRKQSMKAIWNSAVMNALRVRHLEGRREENAPCAGCGQVTHCMADSIDHIRFDLLEKFK